MNAEVKISAVSAAHPFPGLRPFAYQDHDFFFGRQDHFYALYRLVDRFRFIAVVGSSGSGKSSLVRAGLLPLLDLETRESGGRNWVWREMRPGDAPLSRLTDLLASLSVDDDPTVASGRHDRIAAQLRRSSFGISEALADASSVAGKSLVLLIDQFEELFRYAAGSPGKIGLTAEEARARDEATQFVQLLLEASRSPSNRIHVLLTMRSDFIGDCARFHGLPEAVSEAQFLVPSLTRDQLDEVIRRPIEKAGATIDPQLVERLLNDCSTEMDQLPVLQHCLSRLWDEAGRRPAASAKASGTPQLGEELRSIEPQARRISLDHYRSIGEFADALSEHADEILNDLPGPKLLLAVRQVFSALSEFDKEGRATRRALKFSQLVAETGVDEASVRQVLERFRAGDCSFLTPPPFEVNEIASSTRIDVGHEALLRRWDKVSGRGAELGWLRAEQQAGERYRGLLAMTEGDDAVLPAHLVDERWAWWKARPRTPAWADRYGGGFAHVEALLLKSRRRQRLKRFAVAAAFLAVAGVAAIMFALWQAGLRARAEADANRLDAVRTTQVSVGRLAGFINDGTIRATGAAQILTDTKLTLDHIIAKTSKHTPNLSEVEISLLLAASDVKDALGDSKGAFDLALEAEELSMALLQKYPDGPRFQHLLYASKFRIGDQLAKTLKENAANAESEYIDALQIAKQLSSEEPGNAKNQHDVIFILNKLGDIHQHRKDWSGALEQYNEGLRISKTIVDAFPQDVATEINRIAQILSARNQPGDRQAALDEYHQALDVLTKQQDKLWDASLASNIANTHRRIGELLDDDEQARGEYQAAVDERKKLYEIDPGNFNWCVGLVTDYTRLGDALARERNWRETLNVYNEAVRVAEVVLSKDPHSVRWRNNVGSLNTKRGDVLVTWWNEVVNQPDAPELLFTSAALERYRLAAQNYESLLDSPAPPYRELFGVRLKIADVLVRQKKFDQALGAYDSASEIAQKAAATSPVADWQIALSQSLEEAGDFLARESGSGALPAGSINALVYYGKALDFMQSAASKGPDNSELQSRTAALTAKIKSQQSAAQ